MDFGDLALTSNSPQDCASDLALWPFPPSTCSGGLPGATLGLSGPISCGGQCSRQRNVLEKERDVQDLGPGAADAEPGN